MYPPNSESETGKKRSFFEQLQDFCIHFQNEVASIKTKQIESLPGTDPKHYDRGLTALKSEINNIKDLVEETKEKIIKVQQFSHFVESTKELIAAQQEDVQTMEKYLMRYGYQPPIWKEGTEQAADVPISDIEGSEKDERKGQSPVVSPELSEIGKSILQRKNVPVKDNIKVANKPVEIYGELATPIKGKSKFQTPTPCPSSRKRMEQWIASVEAATAEETTILRKGVQSSLFSEDSSPILPSIEQRKTMQLASERKYTPDEPIMSSVTTALLQEESSVTPEEPCLSAVGSSFVRRLNQVEDKTTTTPDEPILLQITHQDHEFSNKQSTLYKSLPGTPLSPQLSDITQKVLNIRHLQFTEDEQKNTEKLSTKYTERSVIKNEQSSLTDVKPESPQLSDLTLKILGRKF